jgi:hypothetical protein
MEKILIQLINLIKLPFVGLLKVVLFIFNLIPVNVYEVHGKENHDSGFTGRGKRELHSKVRGSNKLHFGSAMIAYTRGAIFTFQENSGQKYKGVWSDTYQDIQNKWAL